MSHDLIVKEGLPSPSLTPLLIFLIGKFDLCSFPKKKHYKIWRPCQWVILKQINFWTTCICTPIISSLWCFQPHAPHLLHQYLPISSATDPGPNYKSCFRKYLTLGCWATVNIYFKGARNMCSTYIYMTCSTSTLLVFSGIFWAFAWSPSVLMEGGFQKRDVVCGIFYIITLTDENEKQNCFWR